MSAVTAGQPEREIAAPRARAREIPPLAYTKVEASKSIGVSVDSFERYVMPEIRVVRRGSLILVPVVELERWLDREAERTIA